MDRHCEECGNEMEFTGSHNGEAFWKCPECGHVYGVRNPVLAEVMSW